MSQHDMVLENAAGASFRADLNAAISAIVSNSSGATAPATTYPYQFWADTSSGWLKQMDAANENWIDLFIFGSTLAVSGENSDITSLSSIHSINGVVLGLYKQDASSPCLIKTAYNTIAIKAGTTVALSSSVITFTTQTAVTMPTLTAGEDYSVWVHPDGTASCVVDSFAAPASAPVTGAKKIGGFHYGLVAAGTTVASGSFSTSGVTAAGGSMLWTQTDVDKLIGINEFSIWDLQWRCKGEQYGMAYDPIKDMWAGIYLMSDSPHVYGASRYNTNVASGTVLPYIPEEWGGDGALKYSRLATFEANELASAHGLRLPTYDEFMSFAFGVTEGQSLGGAESTVPATTRQAGYTSRIGIEQATGHQWIIGGPIHSVGGSAWAGVGRGSIYAGAGGVLLGGHRAVAATSGSRCAGFHNVLSGSTWGLSVRAAGDHLNLAIGAR